MTEREWSTKLSALCQASKKSTHSTAFSVATLTNAEDFEKQTRSRLSKLPSSLSAPPMILSNCIEDAVGALEQTHQQQDHQALNHFHFTA